jgi:hypothetical protein
MNKANWIGAWTRIHRHYARARQIACLPWFLKLISAARDIVCVEWLRQHQDQGYRAALEA